MKTHTESDSTVRLPEQRSSGGVRLVYDGATGTWSRAQMPASSAPYNPPAADASATWTRPAWTRPAWSAPTLRPWSPVTMPTLRPWAFRSPAATGSWGVFGKSQSEKSDDDADDADDDSDDVFAAARRRLAAARERMAEARRRMRQYHQNTGDFTGYTNWG